MDQEQHTVETELGTLRFGIHGPFEGWLSFESDVSVNRIPYKVEGKFELYDSYGHHPDRGWIKTGKKGVNIVGYRPILRLDKPWPDDGPTDKARRKIEDVVAAAVLPLFEQAWENGSARRIELRSSILRLEYKIKSEQHVIDRAKENIEKYQQEISEIEEEISQSLA